LARLKPPFTEQEQFLFKSIAARGAVTSQLPSPALKGAVQVSCPAQGEIVSEIRQHLAARYITLVRLVARTSLFVSEMTYADLFCCFFVFML